MLLLRWYERNLLKCQAAPSVVTIVKTAMQIIIRQDFLNM